MSDRITTTRRAAPVVAALAATGLIASGCGGSTANAEPVTSILSAGEGGDQMSFPVPYAVGQTATTAGTFDLSLSVDGFGISETFGAAFDLRLTETVEEVDEDGGAVVHSSVEDVNVLEAPEEFDTALYEGIEGVTVVDHRDAQGESESTELLNEDELTEEQRTAAQEFLSGFESASVVYPDEPVGVGAQWTGEQSIASGGIEIPVTYNYELVELTDETYTIEMSIDTEIDDEVDDAHITGSYSGGGTVTGDRSNALAVSVTFQLEGDADIEVEGETGSMEMSIEMDLGTTDSSGGSDTAPVTEQMGGSTEPTVGSTTG